MKASKARKPSARKHFSGTANMKRTTWAHNPDNLTRSGDKLRKKIAKKTLGLVVR
jgi:hypothetical protein